MLAAVKKGNAAEEGCYLERELAAAIEQRDKAVAALEEAAVLLSTTPKFSCETPEYIMEYLLNAPREKK
jgi:hypothetical protein